MSKPGNYTAYQQYKPLDNGTIQAVQHWSNFYEQKRQNDIAQAQKDKELQGKAEKDKQDWVDGLMQLDPIKATGESSIDEINRQTLQMVRNKTNEYVSEIQNEPKGSKKYIELMSSIIATKYIPKEINETQSAVLNAKQDYTKNRGSKYVIDPKLDKFYENINKAEAVFDPKTKKIVYLVEDPKDPTKKLPITYQSILDGQGLFKPTLKGDWNKELISDADQLNKAKREKEEYDKANNIVTADAGLKPEEIRQIAESKFINEDGSLTEKAKSNLMEKGIYDYDPNSPNKTTQPNPLPIGIQGPQEEPITEKDPLETLIDQYQNDLTSLLDNTHKEKPEYAGANYDLNKALGWANYGQRNRGLDISQQNADTNAAKGKISKTPNMSTDMVLKDKKLSNQEEKGALGVNFKQNTFSIKNQNEDVIVEQFVRDVYIDPKVPGRVIVKGTIYEETPGDFSGKKPTKTEYRFDSSVKGEGEQVAKVTGHLGKTVNEFYNIIKTKMPKSYFDAPKPNSKPKPTSNKEYLRTKYKY